MLFLSKPLKLAILDIIAVLGVASAEAIEFYKLETITKTGASVVGAHTAHGSHAWWRNSGRQRIRNAGHEIVGIQGISAPGLTVNAKLLVNPGAYAGKGGPLAEKRSFARIRSSSDTPRPRRAGHPATVSGNAVPCMHSYGLLL
jgi:hypothetical protein